MIFLAALLHGLIILGLTFNTPVIGHAGAPGLEVLLVSDELPEADRNDSATYLAQRTQLGSGNTREHVAPRNQASSMPIPAQQGLADGNAIGQQGHDSGSPGDPVLTTTGWSTTIHYLAEPGSVGGAHDRPVLLTQQRSDRPGPQDEAGPAQLRGPKREELWITPDTKAATLAPYLDAWRRKVERIGTLNYPAVARNASTRSSPVIEVGIASDGKLDRALIRRSSGSPELDQAALQILKLASPFDPFPPELAHDYRVLRFAYEWQFVGGRIAAGAVSTVP